MTIRRSVQTEEFSTSTFGEITSSTHTAAAEAEAEAARQAAERAAASASIFNDPEFRRRLEAKQLRRKYSVGYIEPHHYRRAMRLLGLLSQGQRLEAADVVWLQTEAEECWTLAVAAAWNELEAQALSAVWRKTGDPWAAVNASSHWRKCDQPSMSLQLTSEALASASAPKVRSALLTTRGGALRAAAAAAVVWLFGLQAVRGSGLGAGSGRAVGGDDAHEGGAGDARHAG